MTTAVRPLHAGPALVAVVDAACARIAPAWPLDRLIAVNPYWGWTDRPMAAAAAELGALAGAPLFMDRAWYRAEVAAGRITDADLARATELTGVRLSLAEVHEALRAEAPTLPRHPLVTDERDRLHDLRRETSWRDLALEQVGRACEAWFDDRQAGWQPDRTGGLYGLWRTLARADMAPRLLLDLRGFGDAVDELPADPMTCIAEALDTLAIADGQRERYLTALLLAVPGWAAACAYRRWEARLAGRDDATIVELLAVRIAWELILYRTAAGTDLPARWTRVRRAWQELAPRVQQDQRLERVLQRALELRYQDRLARALVAHPAAVALRFGASAPATIRAQAVFCIDVRSEVLRRHLEEADPGVATLGFAGFFGLPLAWQVPGGEQRAQLPGLLPVGFVAEADGPAAVRAAHDARIAAGRTRARATLAEGAPGAFGYVETMGLAAVGALLRASVLRNVAPAPEGDAHRALEPRLATDAEGRPIDDDARTRLAEQVLRGMSLTEGFAPLVAFIGHGAAVTNNPQAAGLACGACGGHAGDVNARALAALLNDPAVRGGLAARGIEIPEGTAFVGGLHDTVTDTVRLHATAAVRASHAEALAALEAALADAGRRTRAERAPALAVTEATDAGIAATLRDRARDWSEVRPEWGLARNAAFIAAPRERTRPMTLGGRAFLHEYRWERDAGYQALETILTAPVVVAHWINLQYYASTVDPERFGAGDKVLHNVVGAGVGLYEGAGGDLRTGLARQSVHDGARWRHDPLRLAVYVEAPAPAIDGILAKHATVRALVEHEWIHLYRIAGEERTVYLRRPGGWVPVPRVSAAPAP